MLSSTILLVILFISLFGSMNHAIEKAISELKKED